MKTKRQFQLIALVACAALMGYTVACMQQAKPTTADAESPNGDRIDGTTVVT